MEQKYLMDSNVVIDYLGNKLPAAATVFIDELIPVISVITRIEILGWFEIAPRQLTVLTSFINDASVFPLDETIISETIKLRQHFKIKTPDAIIAATALVHDRILISHNNKDFKKIAGLILVDPYTIEAT